MAERVGRFSAFRSLAFPAFDSRVCLRTDWPPWNSAGASPQYCGRRPGRGEPTRLGQLGEGGLGRDRPDTGDALPQLAVGPPRRRGRDRRVGPARESVGLLLRKAGGVGEGLPRGAGDSPAGICPHRRWPSRAPGGPSGRIGRPRRPHPPRGCPDALERLPGPQNGRRLTGSHPLSALPPQTALPIRARIARRIGPGSFGQAARMRARSPARGSPGPTPTRGPTGRANGSPRPMSPGPTNRPGFEKKCRPRAVRPRNPPSISGARAT
jgi:hypothetical protein